MDPAQALAEVGRELAAGRYRFTPVGAATRRRVNVRGGNALAHTLAEVFGWGRPWAPGLVPERVMALLERAGAVHNAGGRMYSRVGFATIGEQVFAHAADAAPGDPGPWPAHAGCGPDQWRYAALLRLAGRPAQMAVELNCGCGVGALTISGQVRRLVLADADPVARLLAKANALIARANHVQVVAGPGIEAALAEAAGPLGPSAEVAGEDAGRPEVPDLLIAAFGRDMPVEAAVAPGPAVVWVKSALVWSALARTAGKLAPATRLIMYAVVPVNNGEDPLWRAAGRALVEADPAVAYEEIDPDLAPDEAPPEVGEVPPERTAAVGVVVNLRSSGGAAAGGAPRERPSGAAP
jgi:hypothetical protein